MTLAADLLTDLETFFNKDEFAVETTLASSTKINVLFDYNPEQALGIENAELIVTAKYSDISALMNGSTMVIGGITYYLLSIPKNEDGIATFKLSRV